MPPSRARRPHVSALFGRFLDQWFSRFHFQWSENVVCSFVQAVVCSFVQAVGAARSGVKQRGPVLCRNSWPHAPEQ